MAEFPTGDAEETVSADEKIRGLHTCPKCGHPFSVSDTASICPHCGQPLEVARRMAADSLKLGVLSLLGFFSAPLLIVPVIALAWASNMGKDAFALQMRLGFLWIMGFCLIAAVPAIILGSAALLKMRKHPVSMMSRGCAIAGLLLGLSNLGLTLFGVNEYMQIRHGRVQSNDPAAAGNLRTIVGAQTGYKAAHGVYAASFAELTDTTHGPAFLLGAWDGVTPKTGYIITLRGTDNGNCYEATASPSTERRTGIRFFYTNCSGAIRWSVGRPSNSTDPEITEGKLLPLRKRLLRLLFSIEYLERNCT